MCTEGWFLSFVGSLIGAKISYDWKGMPVEFVHDVSDAKDAYKFVLAYDGSGRRISKTRMNRKVGNYWWPELRTHYTGLGTEVRESFTSYGGEVMETKVVVNMPQGLGRYEVEDANNPPGFGAPLNFEWYLKNHLGSTMLVYGTQGTTDMTRADIGSIKGAYYYYAFGEMINLSLPTDKVTETFTGKEHDDEIALDYFGARYLDPMLGLWISVDAKRQYQNPYLYAGNDPIMRIDPDGNADALGTAKTIGHAAGGAFAITGGADLCVSIVGCLFGVPMILAGSLDVIAAPFNLVLDADEQEWPSEMILEKMPKGIQGASKVFDAINTIKSFITKDVPSLVVDGMNAVIDNFSPVEPQMIDFSSPTASSSTELMDLDE